MKLIVVKISKLKQIYTDLRLTQVKSGEIGVFVDNLKRLLITFRIFRLSPGANKCGPSRHKGILFNQKAVKYIFYRQSSFTCQLDFQERQEPPGNRHF